MKASSVPITLCLVIFSPMRIADVKIMKKGVRLKISVKFVAIVWDNEVVCNKNSSGILKKARIAM